MVLSVEIGETVFDAISLMAEVNIGAVLVQQDDTNPRLLRPIRTIQSNNAWKP